LWSDVKAAFRHRSFVVCVLLLGTAAAGLDITAQRMGVRFRKEAIPLRRPLSDPSLKEQMLPRYRFLEAGSLAPEMVEALGTKEFIEWRFLDTTVKDPENSLATVTVFITYYTGAPDQVPHVPDVCYLGSGYSTMKKGSEEFSVPALGELGRNVPLIAVTFEKAATFRTLSPTVAYLFSVNGRFKADRTDVRVVLSNPLDRYAYFSKVEIRFGRGFEDPSREEAIEAAKDVLRVLLPILVKNHYPDYWSALHGTDKSGAAADRG
jgi:hypothetical protein